MAEKVEIVTERFLLRELSVVDVTERYLGWLSDATTKKYVTAAAKKQSMSDLADYVRERVHRSDVLFLGIFETTTGLHIGNIKYEPIDPESGYAIMGIMIGDAAYRGKGVAGEVLRASGQWLKTRKNIQQIVLGVSKENHGAIRAYLKAGFLIEATAHIHLVPPDAITMVWHL